MPDPPPVVRGLDQGIVATARTVHLGLQPQRLDALSLPPLLVLIHGSLKTPTKTLASEHNKHRVDARRSGDPASPVGVAVPNNDPLQ